MGKMISLEEVAERLGVSRSTAYRLVAQTREIPAAKIGRQWRVDPRDLERYILAARNVPADEGDETS